MDIPEKKSSKIINLKYEQVSSEMLKEVMKNKNGANTVMMLGIAGVGLSVAMFVDNVSKLRKSDQNTQNQTRTVASTVEAINKYTDSAMAMQNIQNPANTEVDTQTALSEVLSDMSEETILSEAEATSVADSSSVASDASLVESIAESHHSLGQHSPRQRHSPRNRTRGVLELPRPQTSRVDPPPTPKTPPTPHESPVRPLTYRELYLQRKLQKAKQNEGKIIADNSYYGDGSQWSKRLYFLKEAYRRSREKTPIDPLIRAKVAIERRERGLRH